MLSRQQLPAQMLPNELAIVHFMSGRGTLVPCAVEHRIVLRQRDGGRPHHFYIHSHSTVLLYVVVLPSVLNIMCGWWHNNLQWISFILTQWYSYNL